MKINWGTGIVIAIALFMGFILYMVITMTTDSKYSHDLVVEDYYKQEIGFQDELDAQTNAINLSETIRVEQSLEGIRIVFPEQVAADVSKGSVFFYRVSNKVLDFEIPFQLQDNTMQIPASEILPGRWDVSIRWEDTNGKAFLVIEKITF
jgi:nitrogen fixation protein FixH